VTTEKSIQQAAAIPVRNGSVCLITSISGKRWGIPKGIIDPGWDAVETAVQESWEEAGLDGVLDPEPVGSYVYEKWGGTCHVTVFLMRVVNVHDDWPERSLRRRCWVDAREALARIGHAGLRKVLRQALLGSAG
jgi:8-oxo-dGTP pyrophosphatase MutT (NUDIX family)